MISGVAVGEAVGVGATVALGLGVGVSGVTVGLGVAGGVTVGVGVAGGVTVGVGVGVASVCVTASRLVTELAFLLPTA